MTTSSPNMMLLQLACLVIVVGWLVLRLRREGDRPAFLRRFGVLAAAAWIGEASCIHLYGFYTYAPGWTGFLDVVPVAIIAIWPVVVLSSMDLAAGLLGERARTRPFLFATTVMLLVIADASLIEPIAVRSGLWSWHEPGPFDVPIVGIVGWGFFAFGAALVARRPFVGAVLFAGPVAAHLLLLSSWWLAFRWLPRGTHELPFVIGAVVTSMVLTGIVITRRVRISRTDLWLRIPAASFFFVLLALFARDDTMLVAYAVTFAPPYLALTALARR